MNLGLQPSSPSFLQGYDQLANSLTGPVSISDTSSTSFTTAGGGSFGSDLVVTGSITTPTQPTYTADTTVATTRFVQNLIKYSMATTNLSNITGGTFNFQPLSTITAASITVTVTSQVITAVTAIVSGGSNYAVGDIISLTGGNGDCILRVATVSGTAIASLTILYGGSTYTAGTYTSNIALTCMQTTIVLNGVLSTNCTFILPTLTVGRGGNAFYSNQYIVINNTTSMGNITFKIGNGSGGSTGTGVIVAPYITAPYDAITYIHTDGLTDVWTVASNRSYAENLTNKGIDCSYNTLTNVSSGSLSPTGVTAASYTNASITVNGQGQITAASNGSSVISATPSTVTYAATINPNFSTSTNFVCVLTGNVTLGLPTNISVGQSGVITLCQDSTGSRTGAFHWAYRFPLGASITLSTLALSRDQLYYFVNASSTATVTITIATPGVVTWNSHSLVTGDKIQLTTTGALPTGLTASTTYWVIYNDANSFWLATTQALAAAGTKIATSGSQSGTHTGNNQNISLSANYMMN